MRGIFGEYGLFIIEMIMGGTAFGLISVTFARLEPVVSDGLLMLIGG